MSVIQNQKENKILYLAPGRFINPLYCGVCFIFEKLSCAQYKTKLYSSYPTEFFAAYLLDRPAKTQIESSLGYVQMKRNHSGHFFVSAFRKKTDMKNQQIFIAILSSLALLSSQQLV